MGRETIASLKAELERVNDLLETAHMEIERLEFERDDRCRQATACELALDDVTGQRDWLRALVDRLTTATEPEAVA